MKHLILFTCLVMLPLSNAFATDGGKTLASTLDVYVFPTEGQAADQQSKDEAECYSWATSNTEATRSSCKSKVNSNSMRPSNRSRRHKVLLKAQVQRVL